MTPPEIDLSIEGPNGSRSSRHELTAPIWFGRDAACSVVLEAANVSRRHVALEWTDAGLRVLDASANGTLLDDVLVHRSASVTPKGRCGLKVGPFAIEVRIIGPTRAPRAAPCPHPLAAQVDRRTMHRRLLEYLDLPNLDSAQMDKDLLRPRVVEALRRIVAEAQPATATADQEALVQELTEEALGLGPLEALLADPDVTEIMVVDPSTIFAERFGRIEQTGRRFTDDDSVRAVIERIVTPLGRRIDESTPLVDARLRDGSRVNAVIPPLAVKGPCITIRKFSKNRLTLDSLVRKGSLTERVGRFLERAVKARKNLVISGGTGSGKTTLLNALSSAVSPTERIVTVEDAAELQLAQPHVVSLEARPPNLEGKGEYSIRDLVKNALRMRPDRIVVGECRGGEAIDMLQAMNTGHEGSMTTTHANSPAEAVARLETLCLMSGLDLPSRAIREQIAASLDLVIQQTRFSDGRRRVTSVAEITGISDEGAVELREIFRTSTTCNGASELIATGYLPSFLDEFLALGLIPDGEECL